jgi:hypothetical protein
MTSAVDRSIRLRARLLGWGGATVMLTAFLVWMALGPLIALAYFGYAPDFVTAQLTGRYIHPLSHYTELAAGLMVWPLVAVTVLGAMLVALACSRNSYRSVLVRDAAGMRGLLTSSGIIVTTVFLIGLSAASSDWRHAQAHGEDALNVPEVIFSAATGYHPEAFYLTLELDQPGDIFFTLDGSLPDPVVNPARTLRYREPIRIEDRSDEPHTLEQVQTTYPHTQHRRPQGSVPRGTVITARGFGAVGAGEASRQTYFVGQDVFSRYAGVPIMFLSGDPEDLFGPERGILVAGQIYDVFADSWRDYNPDARWHYQPANFHQRGRVELNLSGREAECKDSSRVLIRYPDHGVRMNFRRLRNVEQITLRASGPYDGVHYLDESSSADELIFNFPCVPYVFQDASLLSANWEREVFAEYFDGEGQLLFDQGMGLRIHGAASRVFRQKSLRFYARGGYGESFVERSLFGEGDVRHKRFLLRHNIERAGLDDVLGQRLMRELHPPLDIQRYSPAALFINGEFFGRFSVRDRYDQWFLANSYDISPDNVVMYRGGFTPDQRGSENVIHGSVELGREFGEIVRFIRSSDMAIDENMDYVAARIDLDNYISYMITGIYLNYTDWGTGKHRLVWRAASPVEGGPEALDGRWRWLPIDLDGAFLRGGPPDLNYLTEIIESRRYLLTFLLENDAFRDRFLERFREALDTAFLPEFAGSLLDEYASALPDGLIADQSALYGGAVDRWQHDVAAMRNFLEERPAHMERHITEFFDVEGY